MWILALGLFSAGSIGILVALLKAAGIQRRADKLEAALQVARDNEARWKTELAAQKDLYLDQIKRREAEIAELTLQRETAIDALENSSCPGNLRDALRLSLGVKAETPASPEPFATTLR